MRTRAYNVSLPYISLNWAVMKNRFFYLLTFLFCFFVSGANAEPEKSTKIGVLLALSGDLAALGQEFRRGVELASDDAKIQGAQLDIQFEDIQSLNPTAAVTAAKKLISVNKIDGAVVMIVDEAEAMAPIFRQNKIPLLILWDSNTWIRGAGEFLFSNGFSTEKAGALAADFATHRLRAKKIAVISHINQWSEIISPAFVEKAKEQGAEIVFEQALTPDSDDYSSVILKIIKASPDVIYAPLIPPHSASFLRQVKLMHLPAPIIMGDALTQDMIEAAGASAEGIYLTNIHTDESNLLTSKYRKRFSSEPMDIALVAIGYDGILRLAQAAKDAGASKISLKDALLKVFGPSRAAERIQRMFKIAGGKVEALGDDDVDGKLTNG